MEYALLEYQLEYSHILKLSHFIKLSPNCPETKESSGGLKSKHGPSVAKTIGPWHPRLRKVS